MNLHEVVAPVDPEFTPTCPNCNTDSNRWWRRTSGTYSETHTIELPDSPNGYPYEDWDNLDQDQDDATPWKCWYCDAEAPEEIQDWIEERR